MAESADRQRVPVRIPHKLLKKLDRRVEAAHRDRGSKWSRNDEIVALLEQALREEGRE